MSADLDHWLTADPADRDCCEDHGHSHSCPICRAREEEEYAERKREEERQT